MLRTLCLALLLVSSLTACDRFTGAAGKKPAEPPPVTLQIAPEDLLTLQPVPQAVGPVVTGSVQPERRADLRAELSAVVLQVLKDNGDRARKGELLVRLDDTTIRDNLQSAEDATRNATLALDQAERTLQRLRTLRDSGMTSLQALDDAEVRRNAARSELSAAQARAAAARQQLERTLVRAPFDGVVGERKVSAGDTAAIGKELLKVIDPRSMRFAARVSADRISAVKLGQAVEFRINGYANQEFRGKVIRIDPNANEVTRQVEVLISFEQGEAPPVAGLYAEGLIATGSALALALPESALVRQGDKTVAWRVRDQTLQRVELAVGPRDSRTGLVAVREGLQAGDQVLRAPGSGLRDGQAVAQVGALASPRERTSSAAQPPTPSASATAQGR